MKYKISDLKVGDKITVDVGYAGEPFCEEEAEITSFVKSLDLWTGEPKIGVTVRLNDGQLMDLNDDLFEQ